MGSITLTGADTTRTLLLGASANGRYLQTSLGVPFQLRGSAGWSLGVQLDESGLDTYFSDLRAKGFNSALFNAIEHEFAESPPNNVYGDAPFIGGDITQPNEDYWLNIDYVVETAARYGIVLLFFPFYLGYQGGSEGWYSTGTAQGTSAVQTYGAFIGERYRHYDNIIWANGGDYQPPTLDIPNALATGLLGADSRHLMATHWGRDSTGTDGSPSWLTLNTSYTTYVDLSQRVADDYANHIGGLPDFVIEAHYEGESYSGHTLTGQDVSREAWQSYLGGACGHFFGNGTIWRFSTGWESALNSDGRVYLAVLNAFMSGVAWWDLIPDAGSDLVTAGRGTISTATYVSAALTSDGTLGVVHVPTGASVTVDLTQMAGTGAVTCRWLDPTTGAYTAATGSPITQGSHAFVASTEVGNNAAGDPDWILILTT